MFGYYLRNSFRSMRRNPALTTLVAMAIAVGIGVSITMLTFYHVMAGNPIPQKSDVLFRVQLDSWNPIRPFDENKPTEPPTQLTWRDAANLLADAKGKRQIAEFNAAMVVTPEKTGQLPFEVSVRVTNGDFFTMFNVPFVYGGGWGKRADRDAGQVVVISRKINDRLFGGENSVGRTITLSGRKFTVVGVRDTWQPMPRFYDIVNSPFDDTEDVFVPISLTPVMKITSNGSSFGWKPEPIKTFDDWLNSENAWLQYWVELPSPRDKAAYLGYLDSYAESQKKLGRFQRPLNNRIYDVMGWMRHMKVVESDVKVLVGLGFLFLLVCLLSSVSLLLTKFNTRVSEMSLRRALGASQKDIVSQNLTEVGIIGAIGGLVGIGFTYVALRVIHSGLNDAPEALFRLDWTMLAYAIGIAVITSLIAGVYPALRTCAITPAHQLKVS